MVFFLRRQPQIFENGTIVARRREHFRGFLAIFLVAIFTTNELVDRRRIFQSNASRFEPKKYGKDAPQARFLMKQNAPQAKFIKQNAPQARILDELLMGPIDIVCNLFFTNHSSDSSSFN